MTDLRVYASVPLWGDQLEVRIFDKQSHAKLMFEPYEEGDFVQPTFSFGRKEAQSLIDQLWNCGLRPTEGSGSAGSLAATERHLEDMKKIAFGLLKKQGLYMTDEQIIAIRKSLPFAHDRQWADTINFARAIAKAEREACVEACKKELLNEPQTSEDLCYQTAVHHCVTRIEDMQ